MTTNNASTQAMSDLVSDVAREAFAHALTGGNIFALDRLPTRSELIALLAAQPTGARGEAMSDAELDISWNAMFPNDNNSRHNALLFARAMLLRAASAQPIPQPTGDVRNAADFEHIGWAVFYSDESGRDPRYCSAKSEAERWASHEPDTVVDRIYRALKSAPVPQPTEHPPCEGVQASLAADVEAAMNAAVRGALDTGALIDIKATARNLTMKYTAPVAQPVQKPAAWMDAETGKVAKSHRDLADQERVVRLVPLGPIKAAPLPLSQQADAEKPVTTEYGWLVENGRDVPDLRYRTMTAEGITWTDDHNKAIRFARRADAEMFAAEDEDAWRIVQHAWDAIDAGGKS
jgi:hypothetical protein